MLNRLRVAWATIAVLAGMTGCGSYSSPDDSENSPSAPDTTGDSTPPPPGYLLK
jgi:hypothetical protein